MSTSPSKKYKSFTVSDNNNDIIEDTMEIPVEEEDTECMICMDNPADTMVLPCEHCVVCKECSEQLKDTHDAKICVRCRREITDILD